MAYTRKFSQIMATKQVAAGASVSTAGQYLGASSVTGRGVWVHTKLASKTTATTGLSFATAPGDNFPKIKVELIPKTSAAGTLYSYDNNLYREHRVIGTAGKAFSDRFEIELPRYFAIRVTNLTDKAIPSGLTVAIEYVYGT